jgi:hypothetical protein
VFRKASRKRKASLCLAITVPVAAWTGACGTGDGTAGLSGRQIVKGHDVSDVFFANPDTLAFTREAQTASEATPQDLWTWGLSDGTPDVGLVGIDWAPPVWWPRLLMGDLLQTGSNGRLFYDFSLRRGTDLGGFGLIPREALVPQEGGGFTAPTANNYPLVTVVQRGGGLVAVTGLQRGRIGVGRPSDVRSFEFPGYVTAMDFLGSDLAVIYTPVPEPDTQAVAGVYKLTVASGELTPLVAPRPLEEWQQTLSSCSTFDNGCALLRVVGCGASDPPCPGSGKALCFVLYAKQSPEDPTTTVPFAYDVSSRGSFRMPGQNPLAFLVSPDQHTVVWQSQTDPEGRPGVMTPRFWDLCTNVEALCPDSGPSQIGWRPGGGGFVLLDFQGPLRVANSEVCGTVTTAPVRLVQYSPSGDRLAWLFRDDGGDGEPSEALYLTSWDGSSPMRIAEGDIYGLRFTSDGQRMILARRGQDTSSLSWLDLTVSPPQEHRLADNYGGFSRGGVRRMLLVDHWNSQDASGDLVLIDIASGLRQALGRAVTEFAVSGDVDSDPVNVAYSVRSRVPAARDGLWLTALPP